MKLFGMALGAGFVGAVAVAVFGTTAAQASPSEQFSGPVSFAQRLLTAHNLERDRVGVPRLAWSSKLAGDAQTWADRLAQSDRLEHSRERSGEGENLWMGQAGAYSAEQMVGGFIAEVQHFRPGSFPDVSMTGRWNDVGHYTQVVWRGTQQVGCAVARGQSNDILVCRYWPAGNVVGEKVL